MANTTYSSMAMFIAKNLIKGKLTWNQVLTNKNYAPYKDEVLLYLQEKGYTIDSNGNLIQI